MSTPMIETTDVTKTFGGVTALDGVTIRAEAGTVLGLLGHNGAGKTTLVSILTTVLAPTTGTARVAGFDTVHGAAQVRRRIGLTGQFAAVDEQLTGRDNLVLIARLLGASGRQARARADELLELFDLVQAAGRPAGGYSGGMRRRLDVAASLVGEPEVVFLDEPTTGLDPQARLAVWEIVSRLVRAGTTILLTTQYLDEADRLADSITLLSSGRVVASGTPEQLKADVGQRTVTVTLPAVADLPLGRTALASVGLHAAADEQRRTLTVPVAASRDLAVIVRALDEVALDAGELRLTEPTLDDVYLALAHPQAPSPAA